jgi:hypothetical protein
MAEEGIPFTFEIPFLPVVFAKRLFVIFVRVG